jgi:hypothetical protein
MPRPDTKQIREIFERCVPDELTGCLEWQGPWNNGYGQLYVHEGDRSVRRYAHRTMWIAMHGPIPPNQRLVQTCGNSACCNVEHMELVGPDSCRFGHPRHRQPNGRWDCPTCREQAKAIRMALTSGDPT